MPPQLIPKPLELDRICRACLGEKGEMRPLYGSCLDNMLRCVAHVEVQAGDGLPELMCLQCVLQVSRAFRFKQQCESSDKTLRDFLAQTVQSANQQVPDVQHSKEIEETSAPDASIEPIKTCILTLEDFGKEERLMVPQEAQHELSKSEVVQPQFCDTAGIVLCEETNEIAGFPSETNTMNSVPEIILTEDSTARNEMFEIFTYEESRTNVKEDKNSSEGGIELHQTISFQCHVCSKIFPKRRMWRRHLKIHDPVKPHVCNECGMSFTESSNLKKHQKKHTGELRNVVGKPNLCSVCGKGFKWASSLSKHMNHHTKKKILNCPHCPKYYVESRSLRIHMRTHTGEKPFICDVCDKGFTQMCNLEKHLRVHTGEKPYVCPVCGKGFSQSGYVAVHLRSHTGEKPYACTECGKSFAGSNTLAIHKKIHTGEKPFACSVCKKAFGRQESLAIHLRTHTGEKSHTCSVCSRGFTCSSHLTIHFRTHTGEKPYVCKLCPKKFISCNSLKAHVKTHEKDKPESITSSEQNLQYVDQQAENAIMILQEMSPDQIKNDFSILNLTEDSTARNEMFEIFTYEESRTNVKEDKNSSEGGIELHQTISFQCHVCSKIFPKRRMWRRHLKIHDPVKPHVCNECGMSFTESSNLKKHQKKHTGELRNVVGKPNLCSVCGKGFKWASSLSKHMNHHTKKKILNCPHCPKYYVESRSLRIHMRTHTGEKPFICDVCDKGFTQMCNLEKHLRVHTGEKPYLCPVCGKGFSQSGYVAVHLRSHTGEKPYACTECGKSFAGSNTLAIHKKIHTGEKPFACSVCKKAFGRQESLAIHLRTHTGEKSHTCSVCSRGFTCSSHLTIHFRTHTGEKPYVCKLCPKKFISCNSLKAHVKTHEKDKPENITSSEQNLQYVDQQAENAIMILQEMSPDQIKNDFSILN